MSLDVYLEGDDRKVECECSRCGHVHEARTSDTLYRANITHNLGAMADAAGIYKALWRPDENGLKYARDLIAPLADGLARLEAEPKYFEKFNAPNGWGLYEHFVPFVREYLAACREYPEARVRASR